MPKYEVELQISATTWVHVEAEDEAAAIADAKERWHLMDCQWCEVTDATTKLYAEKS